MSVRCEVLGHIRVSRDGVVVELGAGRQTQLLAVLVAARGAVVRDGELVDALWPEAPPASAMTSVQAYVSRLRAALDPERRGVLLRQGPGYRVPVEAVVTDVQEFRSAVAEAESAADRGENDAAVTAAERALALFHGTPFPSCAPVGVVAAERVRLEHLRIAAALVRFRALLAAGRHGRVLGELAALVDEAPAHEEVRELHALALYRSGRQSDALEALRAARRVLLEDHGLDPGPGLRRLEAGILEQDPALDLPTAAPTNDGPAAATGTLTPPASGQPAPTRPAAALPARRLRSVPAAVTSFVGRRDDLDALGRSLADHRLVSLVGIGGTGKTRLAVAAAAARGDEDGPWFVDLAPLTEPGLLAQTVAGTLGVTLPGGSPAELVAALEPRRTLLVLDNCEHLLDAVADLVEALLRGCPGVVVLTTSRAPLGLDGEWIVDVAPLDPAREAVELFRQRAGFTAGDEAQDAAVRRICQDLDGLPLALELAAAQCRVLSPVQVADALVDRFALLRTPAAARASARSRGASLETAVRWSVERLPPSTGALFRRLAVFAGGFDLDAAAALSSGRPPVAGLVELVDAGLLAVDRTGARPRYRMLETLRQYAQDISSAEERTAAAADHVSWFSALAAESGGELRGTAARGWFARLDRETPNARAALSTALEGGNGDAARVIAANLAWYWFRRAAVSEGLRWCTAALAAPSALATDPDGPAGEPSDDPAVRTAARAHARCTMGAGLLSYLAGDWTQLVRLGQEAHRWATMADDHETLALCLAFSSYILAYQGELAEAAAASAEAERTARTYGPAWAVADVLMLRAQLLRAGGHAEAALAALEEAVAAAAASDHGWARASAMWLGAKIAWDLDRPAMAALRAQLLIEDVAADGDLSTWLVGLHLLAGAAARLGQGEVGAELLGAVAAESERIGFSPEVMDPVDSPRHVAAVHEAVPPPVFAGRFAAGRELDRAGITALAAGVDVQADTALLDPSSATTGS